MTKLQKSKKGFTLVELAIVIAVIAILIAVLVPTFISLINSAKASADKQMVKNVNTVLATEDAINGINTPSDALNAAAEAGYSVEKLSPTSDGNYIVYDQNTNSFALLDSEYNTVYSQNNETIKADSPSTWWIVTSASQMTTASRSYILTGDIASTASSASTTPSLAKTSVNGGNAAKATAMTISNGVLTYTGFGGINTYNVESSEITEIVYNLTTDGVAQDYLKYYDENAFVINIEISAAKITVNADISVEINCYGDENTLVNVVAGTNATVVVNDYSGANYVSDNTNVTINASVSSTVNTITSTEYTNATNSNGTLQLGTEKYPYLITSVDEWMKIATLDGYSEDTEKDILKGKYWKVTTKLDFSSDTYTTTNNYMTNLYGHVDFDGNTVILNESVGYPGGDEDTYGLFYEVFGGSISNLNLEVSGYNKVACYAYLKLSDITLNGITVNGNIDAATNNIVAFVGYVLGYGNSNTLTLKNCTNNAAITGTGSASCAVFVGKVTDWKLISHSNLHETSVLTTEELAEYNADTSTYNPYGYAKLVFDGCENYGTLIHSAGYASMLIANGATFTYESLSDITVKNCVNYGTIWGFNGTKDGASANCICNLLCGCGTGNTSISDIETWVENNSANLYSGTKGECTNKEFTEIKAGTNSTNFDLSSVATTASSYTISFTFWVTAYDSDNNRTGWGSITVTCKLDSLTDVTLPAYSWVAQSDLGSNFTKGEDNCITIGDATLYTYTYNNTTYFVFLDEYVSSWGGDYVTLGNNVSVTIYTYTNSVVGNIYVGKVSAEELDIAESN